MSLGKVQFIHLWTTLQKIGPQNFDRDLASTIASILNVLFIKYFQIFDFELSVEDMTEVYNCDTGFKLLHVPL